MNNSSFNAVNSIDPDSDKQLSYEQARAALADVVSKLESGGASLADSMKLWERGEALAKLCQDFLDGAQAKVNATINQNQEQQV